MDTFNDINLNLSDLSDMQLNKPITTSTDIGINLLMNKSKLKPNNDSEIDSSKSSKEKSYSPKDTINSNNYRSPKSPKSPRSPRSPRSPISPKSQRSPKNESDNNSPKTPKIPKPSSLYTNTVNNDQLSESDRYKHSEIYTKSFDKMTKSTEDTQEMRLKRITLLNKICELRKQFKIEGEYHLKSPIEELQTVVDYFTTQLKQKEYVETMKYMMFGGIKLIEMTNKRFDYFGFKLDGWSNELKKQGDEYNSVLGELYEKYGSNLEGFSPEIKLMFMIGMSGFLYHCSQNDLVKNMGIGNMVNGGIRQTMQNKMFGTANTTNINDNQGKNNDAIKEQNELYNKMTQDELFNKLKQKYPQAEGKKYEPPATTTTTTEKKGNTIIIN